MKIKQIVLILSLITWTSFFQSCDLNQIENRNSDYERAKKGGAIDVGWIPNIVVYKSMTSVYQKVNIDLNTCIFSYYLPKSDLDKILTCIEPTKQINLPQGIDPPIWWVKKVTNLGQFFILDTKNNDSVFIAIDIQDKKVFGWRNGFN